MKSQIFKLKSLIKVITICLLFFHYINYSFANESHDCEFLASIIEEKFEEEGYFDLTLRGDPALIKELKKRTQS